MAKPSFRKRGRAGDGRRARRDASRRTWFDRDSAASYLKSLLVTPRLATRRLARDAPYHWFRFAQAIEDLDLHIGRDFAEQFAQRVGTALEKPKGDTGLLTSFDGLACKDGFDPDQLDPVIRDFYLHTSRYALKLTVHWNPAVWPFALLYHWIIANPIGQLNVPPLDTHEMEAVESYVELIDVDSDGHPDWRFWVRVMHDSQAVFYVGAFQTYKTKVNGIEQAYLSAAFPFPQANLAVVLKMENLPGGGLLLTGQGTNDDEAGSYIVFPDDGTFSMIPAFGLAERFQFLPVDRKVGRCQVIHDGFWGPIGSFRLVYDVTRKPKEERKRPFQKLRAKV